MATLGFPPILSGASSFEGMKIFAVTIAAIDRRRIANRRLFVRI
jgi:hypothetical protein